MKGVLATSANLRAALDALASDLAEAHFDLPGPRLEARREMRDRTAWTIREYLLPRLGDLDAPVVAVVVGSTGSGKSTMVNSLAQAAVSEPGAIRPTTRVPVVWCHRRHAARYQDGFLTGYGTGPGAARPLKVVPADHPLLEELTLLDAPDFDSVVESHREMADQLLSVADLCIFVTSAQRYADAVPWEFLEQAGQRDLPILFVINRLPTDPARAVEDYRRLLEQRGLLGGRDQARFVEVAEQPVTSEHGGLPPAAVRLLREHLELLADPGRRRRLVEQATRGAVAQAVRDAERVAVELEMEHAEASALAAAAQRSYAAQTEEIAGSLRRGTLIRAEVLRRWQEYLGTGELVKVVAEGAGRARDWLRRVFGGRTVAGPVGGEATSELVTVVLRRADLAAQGAASAWELDPAGKRLLAEAPGGALWRAAEDTRHRAQLAVEDWLAQLGLMVEEQGAGKRRRAQVASYGVNAAAVGLILGVFAHTGGLTGAEVGITAGAAAAQQKLFEHLFGSAAARSLAEQGRRLLEESLGEVLAADGARFTALVERSATDSGAARLVRRRAGAVGAAAEVLYAG